MSRKYGSKVFRKPAHWSEERYEKKLKEEGLFRSREEMERAVPTGGKGK